MVNNTYKNLEFLGQNFDNYDKILGYELIQKKNDLKNYHYFGC